MGYMWLFVTLFILNSKERNILGSIFLAMFLQMTGRPEVFFQLVPKVGVSCLFSILFL